MPLKPHTERFTVRGLGAVDVTLTQAASEPSCEGRTPMDITVTPVGGAPWKPEAPMCMCPLIDYGTAAGRRTAAGDALGFFTAARRRRR